MFREILIGLIVLMIIPVVVAPDEGFDQGGNYNLIGFGFQCSTAGFCSRTYEIECSRTPDGLCPENYGNWNACMDNQYEGRKCFPCDPDCAQENGYICGAVEVELSDDPSAPNSQIYVPTTMYKAEGTEYWILYSRGEGFENQGTFAARECGEEEETCIFDDVYFFSPSDGGTEYNIELEIGPVIDNEFDPNEFITISGSTFPYLLIVNPTQNSVEAGTINFRIITNSNVNNPEDGEEIISIKYYLYKIPGQGALGEWEPVDAETCISGCVDDDCNLINEYTYNEIERNQDDEIEYYWDSTICDNRDYKLVVQVSDSLTTVSDSVDFSLVNENPPCVDDCPYYTSNIFKTILAKIKVWL